jgi:hypothetical protein
LDLDIILGKTRPVLRKNLLHLNNNAILTFKSVEVLIIEDDTKGKHKIL